MRTRKPREPKEQREGREWLNRQHARILAAELHEQQARTGPDEVVHRRVDGETVIQRRLLYRRTST